MTQATKLYKVTTYNRVWNPETQEHLPGERTQVEMMDTSDLAALFECQPEYVDNCPDFWGQEFPGGYWLSFKRVGTLRIGQ